LMQRASAPGRQRPRQGTASGGATFWMFVFWALLLAGIFFSQRGSDVGRLPDSLRAFASSYHTFSGAALRDTVVGALVSLLVLLSWWGIGNPLQQLLKRKAALQSSAHWGWDCGSSCAWGAGITSLLWFFLGLSHLYTAGVALTVLALGLVLFAWAMLRLPRTANLEEPASGFEVLALLLAAIPVLLAGIASLAPPVAKDTLLYHISLPKAFLAGRGLVDVPNNIAQYYALGAELNGAWAMLLGRIISPRAAEAAFGCTEFSCLPLLGLILYGWSRGRGLHRAQALVAVALVACVPTVYASSASAYNDMALTVYFTLAAAAVVGWWEKPNLWNALPIGLALGFALGVKLLALFLLAVIVVVFLLRTRQAEVKPQAGVSPAAVLRSAALAIGLAAAVAGPWYLRNWVRTGSPLYPFYINLLHGSAPGWDAQRSVIDQMLNSRFGGYPKGVLDYLAVPFRISLTAQPELPRYFDGVLGISFLFGSPLLLLAWKKKRLDTASAIATALACGFLVCWLFSSEQMRYLLPVLPILALSIAAAAFSLGQRFCGLLLVTAIPGLLVSLAWFAQQNPLPVVAGLESRNSYLERSLDYYPFYQEINTRLPAHARVWLINMRGDSYYIGRPYVFDFRIEHYTFVKLVWESETVEQLRARVRQAGITHVLARTDALLDPAVSPLVDDEKPAAENERKMQLARSFLLQGRVLRREGRFVLLEL
jgi:hypothetical protein